MKFLTYTILLFSLVSLSKSVSAQAPSRFQSDHLKQVEEARTQAVGGTLVPMALGLGTAWIAKNNTVEKLASFAAVYGLVMGPSFGNFYARDYVRGMLGVAVRLGGGYFLMDATRELAGGDVADGLGWDDEAVSLSDTEVLIGAGMVLAGAVYNVISAKASVNRYNENLGYAVGIVPAYTDDRVVPLFTARLNF